MRTRENPHSSATDDKDYIRLKNLQANTSYRIVWDVACINEGIIVGIYHGVGSQVRDTSADIDRATDGWCTDLTTVFRPRFDGDYFIAVSARGSDFPNAGRYPFFGVEGTLSISQIP